MSSRVSLITSATFVLLTSSLHAQVVGAVQSLPLDLETPRSGEYHGPFCSGDRAFSVVPVDKSGKGRSDVGIIHHLDGSPAIVKQLNIPFVKDYDALNAAFLFQGQPCIVHDLYDKERGEVKLHLQRYTASSFEEDGPPQFIDVLQFSTNAVYLTDLKLRVVHSPDGGNVLLYYDKISAGGFKVVWCCVLGPDFTVLWKGSYKIPVFAYGGRSSVSLTDRGEVLLGLSGVEVTDDLRKQEEDGTERVKAVSANFKRASFLCYRMHGELFQHWDGHLPGGRRFVSGALRDNGRGVYFAGVIEANADAEEMNWAIVRMDQDLQPGGVLHEGPLPGAKADSFRHLGPGTIKGDHSRRPQLQAAADGSMLFLVAGDRLVSVAFDPDGGLRWSTDTSWGSWPMDPDLVAKGNVIFGGVDLSPEDLEDNKAGKPMKETFDKRPVLLSWDDRGAIKFTPLIPFERAVKKGSYYLFKPRFRSLSECGSYVDWDNERRPSLYRVTVD